MRDNPLADTEDLAPPVYPARVPQTDPQEDQTIVLTIVSRGAMGDTVITRSNAARRAASPAATH